MITDDIFSIIDTQFTIAEQETLSKNMKNLRNFEQMSFKQSLTIIF